MADELKACAWCQGPAVNVGGDYITCGAAWNPGCAGHMIQTDAETWNTRIEPEAADRGVSEATDIRLLVATKLVEVGIHPPRGRLVGYSRDAFLRAADAAIQSLRSEQEG